MIRRFEEKAGPVDIPDGRDSCHRYGQARGGGHGMQAAITPQDAVITSYQATTAMADRLRHGPKGIMAELHGRIDGFSKGTAADGTCSRPKTFLLAATASSARCRVHRHAFAHKLPAAHSACSPYSAGRSMNQVIPANRSTWRAVAAGNGIIENKSMARCGTPSPACTG